MPYNWKGDALAKLMILILVLLLLVNSGVIIGFQRMTGYTYKSSRDTLLPYSGYNLVDSRITDQMCAFLLAAPGKENHLILTEKHFAMNCHRVLMDQDVKRNFSGEVKGDLGRVIIKLDGQSQIGTFSLRPSALPIRISTFSIRVPLGFFLWNLALLTVELLLCWLIHKIRNG